MASGEGRVVSERKTRHHSLAIRYQLMRAFVVNFAGEGVQDAQGLFAEFKGLFVRLLRGQGIVFGLGSCGSEQCFFQFIERGVGVGLNGKQSLERKDGASVVFPRDHCAHCRERE